jgi:hypothetical protein
MCAIVKNRSRLSKITPDSETQSNKDTEKNLHILNTDDMFR